MSSKRTREGEVLTQSSQGSVMTDVGGGAPLHVQLTRPQRMRSIKKKISKKKLVKARAPIVETKSRVQSEIATIGGATIPQCKDYTPISGVFHLLPLHAFTCMEQGLEEDKMIGQSLFSKYLNAKIKVRFQGGPNQITDRQFPMELVCGFVQAPTNWTSFTSPQVNLALPSDLSAYVVARVSEYFNARSDELDFIPKRAATIRITYRKDIVAEQNKNNVLNPTATSTGYSGYSPDVMLYPKWKMMRKINYERGNTFEGGSTTGRRNFYPNYDKIPFCCIYSPMYDGEDGTKPLQPQEVPEVSYNVAHYFTDS